MMMMSEVSCEETRMGWRRWWWSEDKVRGWMGSSSG